MPHCGGSMMIWACSGSRAVGDWHRQSAQRKKEEITAECLQNACMLIWLDRYSQMFCFVLLYFMIYLQPRDWLKPTTDNKNAYTCTVGVSKLFLTSVCSEIHKNDPHHCDVIIAKNLCISPLFGGWIVIYVSIKTKACCSNRSMLVYIKNLLEELISFRKTPARTDSRSSRWCVS